MQHWKALLDANVLYPAGVRDILLRLADRGLFRPLWTAQIHDEWIRNLLSDRPELAEPIATTLTGLRQSCQSAPRCHAVDIDSRDPYGGRQAMAGEVSKPHDHLFRSVFGEEKETEAASLLQAYLPPAVSGELLWSSLKWQSVSFIDERLRDSESDLLYAIRRKADGAAAWLYVLLEHQSTPDPWLRLRLLKYSIRIWERDRQRHPTEKQLRPIVPLVS